MDVLISGAGIAGLTVAHWLRRFGWTPVIVERAPSLVVGGYKIDVRGRALEVLHRMEIYDEVVAASTRMQGAVLVDRDGTEIGRMSGQEFGHRVGDDVEIVRGTLCEILRRRAEGIELLFGDTVAAIEQHPDRATVTLASGATRDVDLVIGADGLHSNVRSLVFGAEEQFLRDLGMYLCVFSVPNYLALDRVEVQYSEVGRVASVWSTRDEDSAKACFGFASSRAASGPIPMRDRDRQQEAVTAVYDDVGWEVPRLLGLMPGADDWYFDIAAQIEMPAWAAGRVALAGDAAYCASPMSGQGSSLALLGAYVLAGELGAARDDLDAAFAEYHRVMRPFVDANHAAGQASAAFMTGDAEADGAGLSGDEVEAVIARATERIEAAANAIELKDYSANFAS
jgi:2-polyprenyl-6-methoxyphenol hydroxylase-like FAD-dependent oxidoreductase